MTHQFEFGLSRARYSDRLDAFLIGGGIIKAEEGLVGLETLLRLLIQYLEGQLEGITCVEGEGS